jgi:hypothetical protein
MYVGAQAGDKRHREIAPTAGAWFAWVSFKGKEKDSRTEATIDRVYMPPLSESCITKGVRVTVHLDSRKVTREIPFSQEIPNLFFTAAPRLPQILHHLNLSWLILAKIGERSFRHTSR